MIGNQIINNLWELFTATRRTIGRVCCHHGEHRGEEQWEIDKDLYDFQSDTLIDEYLDLGKSLMSSSSIPLLSLILVIQFGFVTLFVVAFP